MKVMQGKVAIITGGTSGIGAATAELFAAEGATVVIGARRREEGEALAAKLNADFVALTSRWKPTSKRWSPVRPTVRPLDVLVNSVGDRGPESSIADVDLDRFQKTFAVHLGGVLLGVKHQSRVILRQGHGSIVNIASTTGRLAGWSGLGYSTAKAAVITSPAAQRWNSARRASG